MSNVLLIDDDAVFLKAITEALKRGHRDVKITTATTAEEGLRLLSRQHYDVVLSDFMMPGLNGIDLLKECAGAALDTPVILLTGYGSTELERDALHHGAYAVLQKPVDPDVIYSAVTRSIPRAEMLRRSLPYFTPPEIHQRELLSEREQLSARIQAITARLEDTLGSDQPF
jgi:DNA-binding NtrC family response regulator